MKFTVEHAKKVAAELYDEPQARCGPDCEACNAIEAGWEYNASQLLWEYNVSQVLAALKLLEDDE